MYSLCSRIVLLYILTINFVKCSHSIKSDSGVVRVAREDRAAEETLVIGIFASSSSWKQAVERASRDHSFDTGKLLPEVNTFGVQMVYYEKQLNDVSVDDIGGISSWLMRETVSVVIGPYNAVVQLACEEKQVPYLVLTYPPHMDEPIRDVFSLYILPDHDLVHTAVVDAVLALKLEDVAVLYENFKGLRLMGDLMKQSKYKIRAWHVNVNSTEHQLRDQLLEVRQDNYRAVVVVYDSPEILDRVFYSALRLSMLSTRYSWIIDDLNPYLLDYSLYNETEVNFTTFQLFNDSMRQAFHADPLTRNPDMLPYFLAHDAMSIIKAAVRSNPTVFKRALFKQQRGFHGSNFLDVLLKENHVGLTGNIRFDESGKRTNVTLQVMSLTSSGLEKGGSWCQRCDKRLVLTNQTKGNSRQQKFSVLGKEIVKIVTIMDDPFVMRKKDFSNRVGNDRYEGFLIDLIAQIAERMKFKYELYESPDGNYGGKNVITGQWNGMIWELMMGNASMCLGAISITSARETAVDFTKPFKQKKFNLLMKKPTATPQIFQFLSPFSTKVWMVTLASLVIVGVLLYIMDLISPNSRHTEERFNFQESIFFIYATLVGPGTEMVPRTVSGRILSCAWWFVGLILVSSYTANLAAFLTVTKIETPINSIADLAEQTAIKYGTVKNTYAMSMFRSSELPIFMKMWQFMDKISPDSMVNNTVEGIKKVKEGNYAFIWDEPINKYIATQECDLMSTGESFDEKGYGIGVPLGASYRDDVTMVILNLNEDGSITKLEHKWWNVGDCAEFKSTSTKTQELDVLNVAGVFLVLSMGVVLAFAVSIIEFAITRVTRHKKHMKETVTLGHAPDNSLLPPYKPSEDTNKVHLAGKESSF